MADTWQKSGIEYIVKDSTRTGVAGILANLAQLEKSSRGLQSALTAAVGLGGGAAVTYLTLQKIGQGLHEIGTAAIDADRADKLFHATLGSLGEAATGWADQYSRAADSSCCS